MTKQTKIIIGIVAGILVLCIITCVAGFALFAAVGNRMSQSVIEDPAVVQSTSEEIVDFDLPEGFQPENSMDFFGFKVVMYTNPTNDNFMMVMQLPLQGDTATMEQFQRSLERNYGYSFSNMQVIEQRDLTVRGQPATLVVREGNEDQSGARIRQWTLAFQGSNGAVLITIFGPADTWDEATYDRMIESIR